MQSAIQERAGAKRERDGKSLVHPMEVWERSGSEMANPWYILDIGTRNLREIAVSAIKKLMRNTGWTSRTIVKFVRMEYGITDPKLGRKLSRALKRGVRLGLLQQERGRYRLNDMLQGARPVKSRDMRRRHHKQPRPCQLPLQIQSSSNFSTRKRKGAMSNLD